ncbi:MAG: DUF2877 domain-containing protein, partial [Chromatiales bacterium]|nr:DUF2877 domain-containing protein [Chromatiales bacterium]
LDGLGARLNGPDIRAAFGVAARRFKTRSADTDVSAVAALPLARVRTLARAVRMGTPAAINNAINALIGCGPGLTPAGDDVLVGLLAGLYSTLPTGPRSHDLSSSGAMDTPPRSALLRTAALRIETVQAAMRAGIRRTNIISAACLLHATNGEFSERIATLARHIATGAAASATVRATDDALAVGASSGADGVLGLLLGLALGGRDAPAAYRQKGAVAARR